MRAGPSKCARVSGGTATGIVLLIYCVGIAPFVWMAFRPGSARVLAPFGVVAILAVAGFNTGIFQQGGLASSNVAHLLQASTPESRCQQIFQVLLENRILLDRPTPERVVVSANAWDQLPAPVRDAVTACAETTLAGDREPGPIEIIRR